VSRLCPVCVISCTAPRRPCSGEGWCSLIMRPPRDAVPTGDRVVGARFPRVRWNVRQKPLRRPPGARAEAARAPAGRGEACGPQPQGPTPSVRGSPRPRGGWPEIWSPLSETACDLGDSGRAAEGKRVITDIMEIGQRLTAVRKAQPRGGWLKLLKKEPGWSHQTADRHSGQFGDQRLRAVSACTTATFAAW
jgi:hypothetical protein